MWIEHTARVVNLVLQNDLPKLRVVRRRDLRRNDFVDFKRVSETLLGLPVENEYAMGVRESTLLELDDLHVRHNLSEDLLINDHLNHSATFHVEHSRAQIRSARCSLPRLEH